MFKLRNLSLVGILAIALFTSCSDERVATTLIPEDAFMVMSYDIESLAKKGNLEEVSNFSSFKSLENEVKSENRQFYNMLDDIKEDPLSTGIDLRDPIYMFMVPDGSSFFMGMTMHVWDEEDFADFAKKLLDMAKMNEYSEENKNGFTHYAVANRMTISFNSDKALILFNEGMRTSNNLNALAEELTTLDDNDTIYELDSFDDFISNQKDINLFFSSDYLAQMPDFKREMSSLPYRLDGNTISAHLSFEDDKVDLQVHMDYNDDMDEMYSQMIVSDKSFDDNMLDYLPSNNIAAASASINLQAYLDLILESFEKEERLAKNLKAEMEKMDVETLISKIDGNIAMTLTSVEDKSVEVKNRYSSRTYTRNKTLPEFSMIMDINDKEYLKNYLVSKTGTAIENYKGIMKFEVEDFSIYISMNDTNALVTTNESDALNHKDGKSINNSLKGTEIGSNMENYPFYASMKMSTDQLPETARKNMGSKVGSSLARWDNTVDRMEYILKGKNDMQMSLYMKNDDDNSLFQILEFAEQSYRDLNNR